MSRIGKMPVTIPQGVTASVQNGVVQVKGPKGSLSFKPASRIIVKVDGGTVTVEPQANDRQARADFGTTRALINNMVKGVTTGFKRALELNGVGYTAKIQGQTLVLTIGFSHEVKIEIPKEVKCAVTKNQIDLESADRQMVGMIASKIRKVRPPEPYLGKGIKYVEETIRRKAGKTAKK
ncbi:MAG: 50S ribosomal protein L6 [Proteobacteria bacterium]|nr:50S ribosomal protein L6 [Pseudomonadota bacterium]